MTTVSKITVGTVKAGYDAVFIEGNFPTYGMLVLRSDTDESIIDEVLDPQDHNRYGKTGTEAERLATLTNARVIYQA